MLKSSSQFLNNRKYHVNLLDYDAKTGKNVKKRTTITIPIFLADLLAVKLTGRLSSDSQSEIRIWIQSAADMYEKSVGVSVSQWFQEKATYFIADTTVAEATDKLIFAKI